MGALIADFLIWMAYRLDPARFLKQQAELEELRKINQIRSDLLDMSIKQVEALRMIIR